MALVYIGKKNRLKDAAVTFYTQKSKSHYRNILIIRFSSGWLGQQPTIQLEATTYLCYQTFETHEY